jgi:hypothetical protein
MTLTDASGAHAGVGTDRSRRSRLSAKVRLIVAFLGAALVLAGCGGGDDGAASASGDLVTISNVQQVARAFDEDAGHPRLVLLLSPT